MFKRPGSDYWYFSYTMHGKQHRKSTGTADERKAEKIASDFLSARNIERRGAEWLKEFIDSGQKSQILSSIKKRSKTKGINSYLSETQLIKLAERANGYCEITGIPFSNKKYGASKRKPFSASIDRIDSGIGYSADNCRMVCLVVNLAMAEWGDSVIDTLAKGIILTKLQNSLFDSL